MAVINRYSQAPVAMYNPMSMQELAFAPTFLRERHDQTAQALSDLEVKSGQYDVLNQYQSVANQMVDPIQKNIQTLAEKLATEGINRSQAIPQAMKLKSEYTNMFGQAGGIGQLETATKEYRVQAQRVQDFFKDAPELANYVMSKMTPGQAQFNNGKLQLGKMGNPIYVKDIPESEILKNLNTAAAGLKESDLGDYGLQGAVKVGDFDSIVTLASGKGVKAQRAMDLIQNMVGQDQWNSLYQRGAMSGLTAEETKQNFLSKLAGIANSNASINVSRDRYKITDELGLDAAKTKAAEENKISFITPGGRISSEAINPYAGLQIADDGSIKTSASPRSMSLSSGKYSYISGTGASVSQDIATTVAYSQTAQKFMKLKENSPELKNLTNKQALDIVNKNAERYTEKYGNAERVSLDNPNYVNTILATGLNSGAYTTEGKMVDFNEMLDDAGYEDYKDYISKNDKGYLGYRKFGPKGTPVHEFVLSDGTNFFIEAEQNIQAMTQRSTRLNQMILNGELVSPEGFTKSRMINEETGESITTQEININPLASTDAEPYSLKIIPKDDRVNLNDIMLSRIEGQSPQRVKEILQDNFGLREGQDFIIKTAEEIHKSENKLINSTLGNTKTGYMND